MEKGIIPHVRGRIQKFPDWVYKEICTYLCYYSWRSNTKGYVNKTNCTDSQNSDTAEPSGRQLYHLHFSLQVASPETLGYTFLYHSLLLLMCHSGINEEGLTPRVFPSLQLPMFLDLWSDWRELITECIPGPAVSRVSLCVHHSN